MWLAYIYFSMKNSLISRRKLYNGIIFMLLTIPPEHKTNNRFTFRYDFVLLAMIVRSPWPNKTSRVALPLTREALEPADITRVLCHFSTMLGCRHT